jgi:hypothetical protein
MNRLARFNSQRRIWRWPTLLSATILFGLLSALLGQGGIWWILSWVSLATPLAVVAICILFRGRASAQPFQ